MMINTAKLVDAKQLLVVLWEPDSRPCLRWLRTQTKNRALPHIKMGGRVFFEVDAVREAIKKKKTIHAKTR